MQDKFYITTSIAYTNAPPHIGFALELVQADVLARYNRLLGKETFFLTGTDEHGIKVQREAEKNGMLPEIFSSQLSEKFLSLTKALNISNDDFIRTTDKERHIPVVERIWKKLVDNGDIYKREYEGYYCVGCEAFITSKDLEDGKCSIHKTEPQLVKEENYFFRLSKYQKQLEDIISKDKIKIIPEERKNEVLSFIKQGLEDTSFSRSIQNLKWGISVPNDPSQIMYVWADALSNYISAIGYSSDVKTFGKFWPADIQCIGKDILRFHAIYWPAMLLALGLSMPKCILVHGFITSNGQKMSKSLGNVVDPFELVSKYGVDPIRYYILREIPTTKDGDFAIDKFLKRYNGDLASGLGNLSARLSTIALKNDIKVDLKEKISDKDILNAFKDTRKTYNSLIQEIKLSEALSCIWDLIGFCDKYIEKEKIWENPKEKEKTIKNLILILFNISELLNPFLPETAEKIVEQIKGERKEPIFPRI
ncbi:MAG: class I tRNA ligase family protein [Candidatus Paceibacterota bacterium]|jgi:methionyl-tRNA synthetase